MRIIILGASHGTGLHTVKLALEQAHQVSAVARNPRSLQALKSKLQNVERLKVVQGDVLAPETFENELKNTDVVISSIGMSSDKPTTAVLPGYFSHSLRDVKIPGAPADMCFRAGPGSNPRHVASIEAGNTINTSTTFKKYFLGHAANGIHG